MLKEWTDLVGKAHKKRQAGMYIACMIHIEEKTGVDVGWIQSHALKDLIMLMHDIDDIMLTYEEKERAAKDYILKELEDVKTWGDVTKLMNYKAPDYGEFHKPYFEELSKRLNESFGSDE